MLYNQICMWLPGCNFSWSGPCELNTGNSCPSPPLPRPPFLVVRQGQDHSDRCSHSKGKEWEEYCLTVCSNPRIRWEKCCQVPLFLVGLSFTYLLLQRWWTCLDPSSSKALGTTLPFPLPALVTPEEKTCSVSSFSSFFLSTGHCAFWIISTQPRGT